MIRGSKPPSQTWRTFLKNHAREIAAIDFFTVPTVTFRILFCFVVLRHDRRRVVHFNVTAHPSAQWTARQITEAFPYDEAPRFLIRDRDSIYGEFFRRRVMHMGIRDVVTAYRSPWQSPYVERLIGSVRRECLDHMVVLDEDHLRRILASYFDYYHNSRPHLSLDRNSPIPRGVEPPALGKARRFVPGAMTAVIVAGIAILIFGVIALVKAQPYGVYYPLILLHHRACGHAAAGSEVVRAARVA